MWYYFKQSLFLMVYLVFMAITAAGISVIKINWLVVLLSALNIGLYVVIMVLFMRKEGEEGVKKLHANDLEREQIIRTGEYKKLDKHKEYKPWKGFLVGGIIVSPMIICLLIHLILGLAGGQGLIGAGVVCGVLYLSFLTPITAFTTMNWGLYFILLYTVPLIVLSTGFSYIAGGKKILKQYAKIRAKQQEIYGDKN